MHYIGEGKHGAANTKNDRLSLFGLSKARRAGVELPLPSEGSHIRAHPQTSATRHGKRRRRESAPSRTRSRAVSKALKREGHSAARPQIYRVKAKSVARKRGPAARKLLQLNARFAPKVLYVFADQSARKAGA